MEYDEEEYYEEEIIEDEVYEEDYYEEEVIDEEVIEEVIESESEYEDYTVLETDNVSSPFAAQGWREQGVVQSSAPVAASNTFTPQIAPAAAAPPPQYGGPTPTPAAKTGAKSVKELSKNFRGGTKPTGSLQDHLADLAAKRRAKYGEPTEITSSKPRPEPAAPPAAPPRGPKVTTTTTVTPGTAPQTTTIKKKRIIRKKIIRKPDGSTEEIVTVIEPDADGSTATPAATASTGKTTTTTTTSGEPEAPAAPVATKAAPTAPATSPAQQKQVDSGCSCIIS